MMYSFPPDFSQTFAGPPDSPVFLVIGIRARKCSIGLIDMTNVMEIELVPKPA
jgi:hypothetical protein